MKEKVNFVCINCNDEYHMNWVDKIVNSNPIFVNNQLSFVIISSQSRLEINTMDLKRVERSAMHITKPKGRSAITTDKARIYIKEVGGKKKLLGILTHNRVKDFVPVKNKNIDE